MTHSPFRPPAQPQPTRSPATGASRGRTLPAGVEAPARAPVRRVGQSASWTRMATWVRFVSSSFMKIRVT
jgi:hypothetical protein